MELNRATTKGECLMKLHNIPAIAFTALAILCSSNSFSQERTYFDGRSASDGNVPPFSGAVLVGDTLYLSGSIGLEDGGKVPDDAGEEARLVMNTIKAGVEAAGMTMDDIVSVQVFCSDVEHYQAFNDVYRTYFTREFPTRAFVGAGTLLFNARFEVQAIAVKR
jgi:2-iminobutanoate/2-iminopropanoate deaminase